MAYFSGALAQKSTVLTGLAVLQDSIKSVYDWRCIVLGLEAENPMQTFFLGNFDTIAISKSFYYYFF
jgi:hypothetical protein